MSKNIARILAGILAAFMILSLLLSLAACSSEEETGEPQENISESEDKPSEETPAEEEKTSEEEKPVEDEDLPADEESEEPVENEVIDDEELSEEVTTAPSEPTESDKEPEQETPEQQPETPAEPEAPAIAQPDQNGMLKVGDTWFEDPGTLNPSSITKFAEKLKNVKANYISGSGTIAYSVIPDKSNYVSDKASAYLDHSSMVSQLRPQLSGWNYIEIGDLLTFDDYLKTDGHWRQERIIPAANRIASTFGFSVSKGEFTQQSLSFIGDYKSKIGTAQSENISWMVSSHTNASTCDNFQNPSRTAVYNSALLSSNSPYDIFTGGPTPLVTIKNPNVTTGRKLVLFRDSYGSSMAPLLLGGYSEIQLVDLRYMASNLIPQYVNFEGADVLFLFSARVVNNSSMLR
ncbi:MAG: hypothetical protein II376_08085 [Clostridia bacterium]|nr:hypothetical protein [Clostridia bacterium]